MAEAHDLIQNLKAASLQKEKEMETKILEMKMQQDKDLFQLNQENYILQTRVLYLVISFPCSIFLKKQLLIQFTKNSIYYIFHFSSDKIKLGIMASHG